MERGLSLHFLLPSVTLCYHNRRCESSYLVAKGDGEHPFFA
ncbi:UNVERIFIED_ORG: hypothetical protein QOE_4175 [Clostridioides difficile F501]